MSCRWLKHIENKKYVFETQPPLWRRIKKKSFSYKKVQITIVGQCKVISSLPFPVPARQEYVTITYHYNDV